MGMMFLKGTAVAAALVLGAGAASANTVTLDRSGWGTFNGGGFASVTVEANGVTHSANAGGFRITDDVSNFIAWCANIATNLVLPSPYKQLTVEDRYDTTTVNRIHALFNAALPTLDLSSPSGDADSGAFQLALWNILYDNDFSVSDGDGDFFFTSGNTAARDRANEFLAAVEAKGDDYDTRFYTLTFWESELKRGKPISQDLISAAPIPLPAAAWMLLAALGAAAAVSRRRRDA